MSFSFSPGFGPRGVLQKFGGEGQDGRIAARGTHNQLLQTSVLYQQVYNLQLRPQEVIE